MQSLKPALNNYQKDILEVSEWLAIKKNFWQRCLSFVLLQEYIKQKQMHPYIRKAIKKQENDDEYYIKNVIAWLQRDLAKHA